MRGGSFDDVPSAAELLIARDDAGPGSPDATTLAVRHDGAVVARATVTRGPRVSPVARLVRILDLRVDIPDAPAAATAELARGIGAVIRHVGIGTEGVWDVLIVRSPTHGDMVGTAAWHFARTMDYGCDILPRSDDGVTVRLRVPGRRAALAHFLLSAPDASGLGTLARTIAYRLRRRAALAPTAGRPLPEVHMILELPPTAPTIEAQAQVQFHEVAMDAVLAHPRRYASYGIDAEVRLRRGDRCFASEVDGRVIFRMWVSTNARFITQRSERLGALPRAAYVYDSYTDPVWRGRSIRGASLRWLAGVLENEVERIVLSVDGDNLASIRAARKAGFRSVDE